MGFKREIERNAMKKSYELFCKEWTERRLKGEKHGRKPTFNMYVQFYRNAQKQAQEQMKKAMEEIAKKDAQIDTSWDDVEQLKPTGQERSESAET